jgi:phospholipase/carboxylesterase
MAFSLAKALARAGNSSYLTASHPSPGLAPIMADLSGPAQRPASGAAAKQAIVFLHGYGSNGDDLIGLAPFFAQSLPDAMFFAPHAPEPWEGGMFGGRQWFSLAGYDPEAFRRNPEHMAGLEKPFYKGATRSGTVLDQFIDQILADLTLAANKVALVGFSQGTMMALHVAPRRATAIGAVVGFSGAIVGADRLANEVKSRPPMFLVHGDADPVVPVEALTTVENALKSARIPFQSHVVPDLQHGIDPGGATLAARFLRNTLGQE